MAYDWRTEWPNVFARHADDCPVRSGHRCTCGPMGYRASARDPETGRRVLSPDFDTATEARGWLGEQQDTLEAARGVARDQSELGAVIDDFMGAAESGLARERSGAVYTTERIHELRGALGYVDGQLGTMNIQDVRRRHVQALVDQLRNTGADIDRITAVVDALRSLYTYAIQREVVDFSPVVQLTLPDHGDPTPIPAAPSPTPRPASLPSPEAVTAMMAPDHAQPVQTAVNGAMPTANGTMPAAANGAMPAAATTALAPAHATATSTSPGMSSVADQYYQALTPERVLWWTLLIIVVVSVLIAIVLAAESV
jgi:hypothetical protein